MWERKKKFKKAFRILSFSSKLEPEAALQIGSGWLLLHNTAIKLNNLSFLKLNIHFKNKNCTGTSTCLRNQGICWKMTICLAPLCRASSKLEASHFSCSEQKLGGNLWMIYGVRFIYKTENKRKENRKTRSGSQCCGSGSGRIRTFLVGSDQTKKCHKQEINPI